MIEGTEDGLLAVTDHYLLGFTLKKYQYSVGWDTVKKICLIA